jgi:branched-chain amino acid transport system substrate-binding protein
VITFERRAQRLVPLAVLLLVAWLSACGSATVDKRLTLAAVFPTTGADAAIGQAMQRGVDLAVKQNASLPGGYSLTVEHVDEADGDPGSAVAALAADSHVLGIVGPLGNTSAATMLPAVASSGLATISPTATLPGLTQSDAAATEGLSFAQMHPQGKALAFFRFPETDSVAGRVAANVATASTQSHGLAAHNIFVVNDGSLSGKSAATTFIQQLKAKGGSVAGQQTITPGPQGNAQAIVSAIVEANPDIVFYAGDILGGSDLRSTLSLSGVPGEPMLAAGLIADDPDWGTLVGVAAAAANTTAVLPAQDLSTLTNAKTFVTAYQAAYPDKALPPQSALAYDAAMDEIAAIKAQLSTGKPATRAAVLAAVTAAKYAGITGSVSFDKNGDNATPLGFSVYTCDAKGAWHYQVSIGS